MNLENSFIFVIILLKFINAADPSRDLLQKAKSLGQGALRAAAEAYVDPENRARIQKAMKGAIGSGISAISNFKNQVEDYSSDDEYADPMMYGAMAHMPGMYPPHMPAPYPMAIPQMSPIHNAMPPMNAQYPPPNMYPPPMHYPNNHQMYPQPLAAPYYQQQQMYPPGPFVQQVNYYHYAGPNEEYEQFNMYQTHQMMPYPY